MIGGQIRSVVAWSRLFDDQEILLAINTDPEPSAAPGSGCRTICTSLAIGSAACTQPSLQQIGQEKTIVVAAGRQAVALDIPTAGFVSFRNGGDNS